MGMLERKEIHIFMLALTNKKKKKNNQPNTELKSILFLQYLKGRFLITPRVFWYGVLVASGKNMNFGDLAIVCDTICSKTKLKQTNMITSYTAHALNSQTTG